MGKEISEASFLIIEDSDLSNSLVAILEGLDAKEVISISSIVESQRLDLNKYDVILLDLNLLDSKKPDEVFTQISKRCDISKLLIMSGIDNLDEWCSKKNVKYLAKPFNYSQMMKAIYNILS